MADRISPPLLLRLAPAYTFLHALAGASLLRTRLLLYLRFSFNRLRQQKNHVVPLHAHALRAGHPYASAATDASILSRYVFSYPPRGDVVAYVLPNWRCMQGDWRAPLRTPRRRWRAPCAYRITAPSCTPHIEQTVWRASAARLALSVLCHIIEQSFFMPLWRVLDSAGGGRPADGLGCRPLWWRAAL